VSGFSRTPTIIIQPSMGFGTGHHASTRLCLAAMQQIDLRAKSVLDVGTGSGVLAIAARMLGALDVLGIDDDPDAIESARENVALNPGVGVELQVVNVKTVVLTPFDVVIANLTGGLLMQTAERLQELTAPTGRLIISGFTQTEEVGVLAAFRGFQAVERMQEDEWMCAVLQREAAFR
jgi:ribosomal protein L11 methyltransferase